MPDKYDHAFSAKRFRKELEEHNHDLGELPGWMFEDLLIFFDRPNSTTNGDTRNDGIVSPAALWMKKASDVVRFAGARVTDDIGEDGITHVVIGEEKSNLKSLRREISGYGTHMTLCIDVLLFILQANGNRRKRLPRIVMVEWVERSWAEGTRLDEERVFPSLLSSGKESADEQVGFAPV